jgi:MoxR-like ATPase
MEEKQNLNSEEHSEMEKQESSPENIADENNENVEQTYDAKDELPENESILLDSEPENQEIIFVAEMARQVKSEIQKVIIGQDKTIDLMLTALFSGGNLLLEGVPGVAKTLLVKLLARTLDTSFKRIQFTPDLMPSDVIGTTIFDIKSSVFHFREGPLFSNFILVDEVNRAPAKTQAALIEAMEEKQVTVDGKTYRLEFPLFITATQNPVEQEGTYKLPEAQLDRFIFKLDVEYPDIREEEAILTRFAGDFELQQIDDVKTLFNADDIKRCMNAIQEVHITNDLIKYIAAIVTDTRKNNDIFLGASPRASLSILRASKAVAAINGRDFVTPDDIRDVTYPVLNHRIILSPEREIEGVEVSEVIDSIIQRIEVPR